VDENKPAAQPQPGQPQAGQPQQQQVQVPVDVANRETVYLNFVRLHPTPDELFVDIGVFGGLAGGTIEPIVVSQRLIMNYATAKRLATVLRDAVARHEQMFGVVEIDPNRRLRVPPQPAQPPRG
jgi:hypothetical protein